MNNKDKYIRQEESKHETQSLLIHDKTNTWLYSFLGAVQFFCHYLLKVAFIPLHCHIGKKSIIKKINSLKNNNSKLLCISSIAFFSCLYFIIHSKAENKTCITLIILWCVIIPFHCCSWLPGNSTWQLSPCPRPSLFPAVLRKWRRLILASTTIYFLQPLPVVYQHL